jgi:hypothetical protein
MPQSIGDGDGEKKKYLLRLVKNAVLSRDDAKQLKT